MKPTRSTGIHVLPGLFVFVLIGLFALSALTLTLIGTRVYRRATDTAAQVGSSQMVLSYLGNKIRTFDTQDAVRLETRDGLPVLCLRETLDGEVYETLIYVYRDMLWERFAAAEDAFDPEGGEQLAKVRSLTVTLAAAHLLQATVVMPDGETRTLRVALLSGPAKEAR